jgi:hypothetical protein
MSQPDAWRMIRRRAAAAGIAAEIGCHTFRATGITAYLANGGALEHAQEMAAHESPRTTKLYDRTKGAAHPRRGGEGSGCEARAASPTRPSQGMVVPRGFPGSRSEVTDFRVFGVDLSA